MQLNPTYYDIIKKRRPNLINYINQDIENIKLNKLQGPFGSVDEYSKYFDNYLNEQILIIINNSQKMLLNQYPQEYLINEFKKTHLYQELGFMLHAEYVTITNFELFNKKTFYFTDNLVQQLSATSLDISSEYIIPPFNSCLFVYTSPIIIKALYRIGEIISNPRLDIPVNVFVLNRIAEEGKRKIVFACWHSDYKKDYFFIKRELLVREDWTIEQMLKTDWREIYTDIGEEDVVDESIFYKDGLLFFRILINSILYLGSNEADIIENFNSGKENERNQIDKRKKKREKKRNFQFTELNTSLVGSNLEKIIIKKLSDFEEKKPTDFIYIPEKNNKITKRFIVQGHWRTQPYGEKGKYRKIIWIKPYYKGPEEATLINKTYEIK